MEKSAVLERFLRYVQVNTRSAMPEPGSERQKPSSKGQVSLGNAIMAELVTLGVMTSRIRSFEDGSFLVSLPASDGYGNAPHVAFAAHMDTYFGVSGEVKPIVHAYEGGDIRLPNGDVTIPATDLVGLEGKHIVTGDGTSLLGGDDKAGVAALVTTISDIITSRMPHGPLSFWFCVDEEIGELDIKVVPEEIVKSWSIFWNVDGERVGPIDVGCFICRFVDVTFKGVDAHPGVQADKLKPAHYSATTFMADLSEEPAPWETTQEEPFCYITRFEGNASQAIVHIAPRAFSHAESDAMLENIRKLAQDAAHDFRCTCEVQDRLVCVNTRPSIEARMSLLEPGLAAHRAHGFEPKLEDVRGGTDGAMVIMAYPNLPSPNMGTGGKNLHGPQEFVVVEELEALPRILHDMILGYSKLTAAPVSPSQTQS